MVTLPVLLSAALLLLPGTLTLTKNFNPQCANMQKINITVTSKLLNTPAVTYPTDVVCRGTLLGAMNRLNDSNSEFTFTYSEDSNYGPFLESVNGVAGNDTERTYWELLVMTENKIERLDVGIGCYIPSENDEIFLHFTQW